MASQLSQSLSSSAIGAARRVTTAAHAELDLLLGDLRSWVNIDTPTGNVAQLDLLARRIAEQLERYGLTSELVTAGENGLYLHAGMRGSGRRRIALLCHHDTVLPLGTVRERPFTSDGAHVYGPGVADMKGGIVVAAHAARLLAGGPRPFGYLEVVSVPDEELREGG